MFVQCNVYFVQCTPFPPVAEICARLADNFCQYMTTVSCWAKSLVCVAVCYFTASLQGGGEGECGNSVSVALNSLTLPGPGGESREGGYVPSPWFESAANGQCEYSVGDYTRAQRCRVHMWRIIVV